MWPFLLALSLSQAPKDLFSGSANPPKGGRQTFEVKGLVAGERYTLTTTGKCEGPTKRRRVRVSRSGVAHEEPFGLEYRVFLGRLEFSVDADERSQSFRADEGIHTLIVENRSSDTGGTVSCKLTSITIRPE